MVNQQFSMTSTAYAAGSTAYHEQRIGLEAWHLYEKLVFWAGDRGYCWHKIATLAETFGRSARHVGRWLHDLVTAGLIRRVRRSHTSSETYITALSAQPSFFDAGMSDHDETPMSDRTIKSKGLNGGGKTPISEAIVTKEPEMPPSHAAAPSPAVEELRAAGLVDDTTLRELATKPPALIRQAVAYVQAQRHAGPGLIAWLLGNDKPIPERHHAPELHRRRPAPPTEEARPMRRRLIELPDGTCYTEVIDAAT